ncbi:MAG: GTP 3',8-cyclase MoaA [Deltaproteobacteria bacterium]|nr:GTP 3',8-cyclase MoaA [Deltaproteobacteria bacterium]
MRDLHGRAITYLRLSITDLCNLRCFYCMPSKGVVKLDYKDVLRLEEQAEIVHAAAALGVNKVRITGGEPLVRRGLLGLVRDIAATPGIDEVALTTNGLRLARMAADLKDAGLARINVSLDSLDPATFAEITRGGNLDRVLAGIDAALEQGFKVKINTVLLEGINTGDLGTFVRFARDKGLGLRFIERMGFDKDLPVFSQDAALESLGREFRIEPLPIHQGHPHVRRFDCGDTWIGFISPMTHSFCEVCNKLRLTVDGSLRVCLASSESVDLRPVLRAPHSQKDVERAILRAVELKPLAAPWNAPGEMWKVGG